MSGNRGAPLVVDAARACARKGVRALVQQFAERSTQKKYLAIVRGLPPESFTIDLAMRRATNAVVELKMATASGWLSLRPRLRRAPLR